MRLKLQQFNARDLNTYVTSHGQKRCQMIAVETAPILRKHYWYYSQTWALA